MQGIPHSAHSNERAVEGIGHTPDYAPTIEGGVLRCFRIHYRVTFRPPLSVKLRGDLVRHLLRMGKDRERRNLLEQGDKLAHHRLIHL